MADEVLLGVDGLDLAEVAVLVYVVDVQQCFKILYLLVQAGDDGYCGFPKGHMEGGESEEETAYRETWEETSLRVRVDTVFRYEIFYSMRNGNRKKVVYFPGDFSGQTPCHNQGFERFRYLLLPFEEACEALTFENARAMLKKANAYLTK